MSIPLPVSSPNISSGNRRVSPIPLFLELDRAYVIQGRVHPCPDIPKYPGDGFIFRLTHCFKALAMQPFHLQRAEQRLRAGIEAPMSRVLSR